MKDKVKKYEWYHQQWGKPVKDDQLLFLLLTVGVFQVGLSWKAAAGKLEAYKRNFYDMDVQKVAAMMPDDIDNIMQDLDMIRNPRKIKATIQNAQAIVRLQKEYGSFADYLWQFVGGLPIVLVYEERGDVPTTLPLSTKVAKELKKKGFSFVGPVVTCMFMKASGMIQDEILDD